MTAVVGRGGRPLAGVFGAFMLAVSALAGIEAAAPATASPTLLVVRFEAASGPGARQGALNRHGLIVVDEMADTEFVLVRSGRTMDADALAADPAVATAQPPVTVRALGSARSAPAPEDPLFPAQWHLRAVGVPRAWDVSTGKGVVVAVLDTGIAYEDFGPFRKAPDLAGTTFVPGWDFVDDDEHPNDQPAGGKGSHGTAMAGTIAQTTNNGIGGAGVAPDAAIMPVRVLSADERGTSFNIAKGLRFAADHGAKVANLSLGTSENPPELADAVAYAIAKGVTVVASSGDGGTSGLTYPAAYPDVLAVGATTYTNARAEYSNYGPGLDLMAPGGELEEDENHDDLEDGVVQQALYEQSDSFCFCFREGTSSAAAHVSGVVALVLSAGKAATPARVRDLLVSTAAQLGPEDEYGAGLVQSTRALGMPALPGETPPSVGGAHDHDDHDDHDGDHEGSSGAGHERPDRSRPPREALRPPADDRLDTRVAGWFRRRRAWLLVPGGLVLLAYLVPVLVRRRRNQT